MSVLLAVMLMFSSMAYAAPQNIDADGEYMMATSDTLDSAKEKALQEALRSAVEQAGVYVESYTKVKDMALTDDQIRILAGNIIKVEKKTFSTVASGNTFLIKCSVRAVIDTDSIDLQRVMEMKKTQEENVRLTKTVSELQKESESLRQKYQQAQSESDKLRIKNELLTTEKELGNLYKKDYQGENVLQEVNAATAEFSNFGRLYPGMPDTEFTSQVERQLIADGYRVQTFLTGSKNFYRVIDENVAEEISYNPTADDNNIFFYTSSKLVADKIYTIAFANMYSMNGTPQRLDLDESESATWVKESQPGKQYTTQIYKHYDGKKYWVRISKSFRNTNAVKHSKFAPDEVLRNLAPVNGNWYDEQGNKVLSIGNGYINGCKVVDGFDFAGGRGQYGVYRIMENSGPRDITIQKLTDKMIKVDNRTILKNTASASYYESVNGIYLGMTEDDVASKIGRPERVITNAVRPTWAYASMGISIQFEAGNVVSIKCDNNGKWFFDRSKLNYRNPISDYVQAYKLDRTPRPLTPEKRRQGYIGGASKIADGEYLWLDFYPDSITLSIFWN